MRPERHRMRPAPKTTSPRAFPIPHHAGLRVLLLAAAALFKGDSLHENPNRAQEKPPAIAATTQDAESASGNFRIGPWELHFEDDFPISLRESLKEIFARAFEAIQNLMGTPSQSGKGMWTVHITEKGGAENTQKKRLEIALDTTDALKIHEFAHMFQGDDFPEFDWIREGMAVAISNMGADKIGVPRWDIKHGAPPVLGKNLKGNIGLAGWVPYSSYGPLMPLRLYLSGKFWEELEKSHPGSIRTLTKNLHDWYRGKIKEDAEGALVTMTLRDFFTKFLGWIPDFTSDIYENLLSPRPLYEPSYPYQDIAFGSFEMREGRPQIYVQAVRKFPDSHEEGHPGKPGVISFVNPQTGLVLDYPFQTEAQGTKVFDLNGIKDAIGFGPLYHAHIEIEGCHAEDIEFSF